MAAERRGAPRRAPTAPPRPAARRAKAGRRAGRAGGVRAARPAWPAARRRPTTSPTERPSVDEPVGRRRRPGGRLPGPGQPLTPSTVDVDDEELAKQLATLSPRAANAIRAAAEATTDEERDAALDEVDDDDQPLNRGLLLKFLSSVKS